MVCAGLAQNMHSLSRLWCAYSEEVIRPVRARPSCMGSSPVEPEGLATTGTGRYCMGGGGGGGLTMVVAAGNNSELSKASHVASGLPNPRKSPSPRATSTTAP